MLLHGPKGLKYSCEGLRVKNLLNSQHFKKHFMFLAGLKSLTAVAGLKSLTAVANLDG